MRLLHIGDDDRLRLTKDSLTAPGPYAILSHTWGDDEDEITFEDVQSGLGGDKTGSIKLEFCANQAHNDGLEYFWVDTCCIDKTNHVELSEAVTSMFRWYRQAAKCYVYLSDVSVDSDHSEHLLHQWESAFRHSRWFTRGWTLQELLAPANVEFFSREQRPLGNKQTLEALIHDITKIPLRALRGEPLSTFPVDERLQWTNGRHTKRVEDQAYCLVGIFDISMSLRYGEAEKALDRLQMKVKGISKNAANHELINWLAPSRPREFHAKASASRHPGTGLHFIERSLLFWLRDDRSQGRLLWISGKSGTGKTTLFSHMVEATEIFATNISNDAATSAFAYHYCTFTDPESQEVVNILGSFAAQICTWQPSILQEINAVFERDKKKNQAKTLQAWELEKVLIYHVSRFRRMTFMLDAINESKDFTDTFASIMRLLQQLPNLNFIVTSTIRAPAPQIDSAIQLTQVQIDPDEDIRTFVDFHLSTHATLQHLSAESKAMVRSTLVGKANDSFRWVSVTLDNLRRQRTGRAVRNALAQVPEGLNNTYASMLSMIPDEDRAIARAVLLWLCFALRPLTLLELSEAAVLDESDTTIDQDSRLHNPDIILEICRGLIEHDIYSGEVKLAHSTVKDYLLSDQIRENGDTFFQFEISQGNRALMRGCLTYLMFDDFRTGPMFTFSSVALYRHKYPLMNYAAYNWGRHARYATDTELELAQKLFSTRDLSGGGNYVVWVGCLMQGFSTRWAKQSHPLYYAASFGITPLIRALLAKARTVEEHQSILEQPGGRFGSTPLQVACFRGQKEAVECLLAAGADFWSCDRGCGQPPWAFARENGWTDIVEHMLRTRPEIAEDWQWTHDGSINTPIREERLLRDVPAAGQD